MVLLSGGAVKKPAPAKTVPTKKTNVAEVEKKPASASESEKKPKAKPETVKKSDPYYEKETEDLNVSVLKSISVQL